jgi:exodeoxyribonuclease VII small subunit
MSKTPTSSTPAPTMPASYEEALQELEALVSRLDAGQLPLDDLLTQYQRGADLLALCRSKLDAVEQQIQVLEKGEMKPWVGEA